MALPSAAIINVAGLSCGDNEKTIVKLKLNVGYLLDAKTLTAKTVHINVRLLAFDKYNYISVHALTLTAGFKDDMQ